MSKRTWSDANLRTAIASTSTIAGTLRFLGLTVSPGNYRTIANYVAKLGLDTSHHKGQAHGSSLPKNKLRLEDILVQGSSYGTVHLRRRLIKEGLLKERCAECGLLPEWNQKRLTLQLDHVNGDPFDNRLENLRILCPNCHSQTSTFTRRKKSRYD